MDISLHIMHVGLRNAMCFKVWNMKHCPKSVLGQCHMQYRVFYDGSVHQILAKSSRLVKPDSCRVGKHLNFQKKINRMETWSAANGKRHYRPDVRNVLDAWINFCFLLGFIFLIFFLTLLFGLRLINVLTWAQKHLAHQWHNGNFGPPRELDVSKEHLCSHDISLPSQCINRSHLGHSAKNAVVLEQVEVVVA